MEVKHNGKIKIKICLCPINKNSIKARINAKLLTFGKI